MYSTELIGGPWGGGAWGGTCPPKILLASLWGGHVHPQNFYRIHNDLESLFEKNKQIGKVRTIFSKFVQNFFKKFSKFSKISNISYNFCKIFLSFPTNHP